MIAGHISAQLSAHPVLRSMASSCRRSQPPAQPLDRPDLKLAGSGLRDAAQPLAGGRLRQPVVVAQLEHPRLSRRQMLNRGINGVAALSHLDYFVRTRAGVGDVVIIERLGITAPQGVEDRAPDPVPDVRPKGHTAPRLIPRRSADQPEDPDCTRSSSSKRPGNRR